MPAFTDIWEVTPETAHPNARRIIAGDSLVWDFDDDDSPVGSDIGADTFAAYLDFRKEQPNGKVEVFIHNLFDVFELEDSGWDLLDPEAVEEALSEDDGAALLTRDDFILGLAFAQLLTEGTIDAEVKRRAELALKRQSLDLVLEFRGDESSDVRKEQLEEFAGILADA